MTNLLPRLAHFLRIFARTESGATAAEFALVLPLFLTTVFSTIYLSFLLGAVISLHAATEQAARCLAVNISGTCTSANLDTYAKTLYQGPAIAGLAFTLTEPACGKQVSGNGSFTLFTGAGSISVPLSASACYPVI
ncbi:pilus assembly protein (plasmid) [Sphingobium sp. V4]|uniref:TadE/TadG family type IV pilus assembly protein n=1 Tax=Sphingobium sp. V4 TaxID=3038927 RepID=UPI002557DDCA|nr:TadE/TadG family type IV pilus assembly protein [Sphingobium sp. V4]WIW90610.1 pilus assembly protein [Sphingobium sp. V4]